MYQTPKLPLITSTHPPQTVTFFLELLDCLIVFAPHLVDLLIVGLLVLFDLLPQRIELSLALCSVYIAI